MLFRSQLQMSAPVQQGSSGGPVLDTSGNVIGVVVGQSDALRMAGLERELPQSVNFAVKASTLINFLDAHGVAYSTASPGAALSVPDVAERAKMVSIEVRCQR